ncbi:MAG: integral membrane sensor signal transduction histidine kinase, partial [bacterium]
MQSLSFRIFAGLLIVLLGTFALYSYLTLRFYTDQTLTQVYEAAYRASDVIKSSTHYSMMLNRKEDVYQIIRTIGREPGVDGIRIYNKRGLITFSTDSTEAGTLVDLNAEACFGCHERSRPLSSLPMSNRMRVYSGSDGYRLVGLINPVRNEVGCGGGGCHESPQERSVLGVLDVRMSLQRVDQDIATMRRRAMVHTVLALLGIATASGIFVAVTIRRPVRRLIRGTEQITAGHLDHEIPVTSTDELGRLAHSFNEMTRSLQRAQEENQTWAWTLEERVREKSAELQLAGILAYTRLVERRLKRGALTEELTRECLSDLELIGRETARCGNIARNLLLFSRRQTSDMAVIAVREIIARAARLIAHHMEMAHVRLESSCRPADLCFIGDEDQAQQALVALFVNAVEAMPDG